jgi:hypothetical protein
MTWTQEKPPMAVDLHHAPLLAPIQPTPAPLPPPLPPSHPPSHSSPGGRIQTTSSVLWCTTNWSRPRHFGGPFLQGDFAPFPSLVYF